jgi:hypothetical protein
LEQQRQVRISACPLVKEWVLVFTRRRGAALVRHSSELLGKSNMPFPLAVLAGIVAASGSVVGKVRTRSPLPAHVIKGTLALFKLRLGEAQADHLLIQIPADCCDHGSPVRCSTLFPPTQPWCTAWAGSAASLWLLWTGRRRPPYAMWCVVCSKRVDRHRGAASHRATGLRNFYCTLCQRDVTPILHPPTRPGHERHTSRPSSPPERCCSCR